MLADSTPVIAGQTLIAGFPAGPLPDALLKAAGRGELGGFILFRRNLGTPEEILEQNAGLWAACKPTYPPAIALDQEGGRVSRLGPPVLQLPPMRKLGAIEDALLTESCAHALGRQLALLGFTLDFAPVLDVDSNPANPVIGDRSFGSQPERVIRHARAFMRGLARAGITSCGKHFPGHGDTAQDSHFTLPRLSHSLERIEQIELRPFAALAKELPSIMTAHVVFDALDPERPATLSRNVITGLLRQRLGFDGVIVSDDLEMRAIADHLDAGRAACDAIEAGCDALLVCSDPERLLIAHEALVRHAETEPAFAHRLRDAAERCLRMRREHVRHPAPTAIARELATITDAARRSLDDALASS